MGCGGTRAGPGTWSGWLYLARLLHRRLMGAVRAQGARTTHLNGGGELDGPSKCQGGPRREVQAHAGYQVRHVDADVHEDVHRWHPGHVDRHLTGTDRVSHQCLLRSASRNAPIKKR